MRLTQRQAEVLALLAQGLRDKEIARVLFLSPLTIKNHKEGLCERLGARNVTHAVAIACLSGLLKGAECA